MPDIVFYTIVILAAAAVLFIPGMIAHKRRHKNAQAISVCGLLGPLTGGISWIIAFVWSLTDPNHRPA